MYGSSTSRLSKKHIHPRRPQICFPSTNRGPNQGRQCQPGINAVSKVPCLETSLRRYRPTHSRSKGQSHDSILQKETQASTYVPDSPGRTAHPRAHEAHQQRGTRAQIGSQRTLQRKMELVQAWLVCTIERGRFGGTAGTSRWCDLQEWLVHANHPPLCTISCLGSFVLDEALCRDIPQRAQEVTIYPLDEFVASCCSEYKIITAPCCTLCGRKLCREESSVWCVWDTREMRSVTEAIPIKGEHDGLGDNRLKIKNYAAFYQKGRPKKALTFSPVINAVRNARSKTDAVPETPLEERRRRCRFERLAIQAYPSRS